MLYPYADGCIPLYVARDELDVTMFPTAVFLLDKEFIRSHHQLSTSLTFLSCPDLRLDDRFNLWRLVRERWQWHGGLGLAMRFRQLSDHRQLQRSLLQQCCHHLNHHHPLWCQSHTLALHCTGLRNKINSTET